LNIELKNLNADLEGRVEQRTRELAAANQELEAFSYSVSHDLRAPLRTIDGFSLALQEDFTDVLNDEGRDYIARVRNGVQRRGSLIDALLQLSRVTRGDIVRESIDLSQLAMLVFNEMQASAAESGTAVFTAQPGAVAEADPRLMRVALENLIGNAVKYSSRKENPRIEFGSEPGRDQHAGQTVYFIRDNGAGFDMHYVDRLFTAFQRLHGDRDFKGSGIGLATVSRIIRRHHGNIWAIGEIGLGSTFYFTLAP
jgi:light-regulated signal transduction histidine kinase (bacteriophytochrome)